MPTRPDRRSTMDEKDFISTMTPLDAQRLRKSTAGQRPRNLLQPLGRTGRAGFSAIGMPSDVDTPDQTEVFQNVIAVIRWGMYGLAIILAAPRIIELNDEVLSTFLLGFLAVTVVRHARPIRLDDEISCDLAILTEVTVSVGAVILTGLWISPLAVTLGVPIVVAGFARGHVYALRVSAVVIALPTAALFYQDGVTIDGLRAVSQWAIILVVIGLIAGQTRRITGEAGRQRSLALNRMERLSDANSLLYSLHRVAQTLPASLDLNEVLDTSVGRLRGLFDYDVVALFVFDETDASWQVMRSEGAGLPLRLGPTELPNPLKSAIAQNRLIDIADLRSAGTVGLSPTSGSGLYTTLIARGHIIGLLTMEHSEPNRYDERTVQMFNGFVDPVALAVDNARWFGRLRTMGADEERTRIARDLHDRIGQSMAFLAFELDRVIKQDNDEKDVGPALDQLQRNVREVIREIRDTLSDLRTDVNDNKGLEDTIADFAQRVAERSGLEISVAIDARSRLPIMQERELWRIAQEAMINVERHAEASEVTVSWTSDGESGVLEVSDNGRGFAVGESGRVDSYGLVGMRERAASVGASMEVESTPGGGTTIRCLLSSTPQPQLKAA